MVFEFPTSTKVKQITVMGRQFWASNFSKLPARLASARKSVKIQSCLDPSDTMVMMSPVTSLLLQRIDDRGKLQKKTHNYALVLYVHEAMRKITIVSSLLKKLIHNIAVNHCIR